MKEGRISYESILMEFPALPHIVAWAAKTHSPTEPISQQNPIRMGT